MQRMLGVGVDSQVPRLTLQDGGRRVRLADRSHARKRDTGVKVLKRKETERGDEVDGKEGPTVSSFVL